MSAALKHRARRVAADPLFLAHQLDAYQRRHGLDDVALAERLGCAVAVLAHVRLCGAVRWDHFAADCALVADRFGLRVAALEDLAWPW